MSSHTLQTLDTLGVVLPLWREFGSSPTPTQHPCHSHRRKEKRALDVHRKVHGASLHRMESCATMKKKILTWRNVFIYCPVEKKHPTDIVSPTISYLLYTHTLKCFDVSDSHGSKQSLDDWRMERAYRCCVFYLECTLLFACILFDYAL